MAPLLSGGLKGLLAALAFSALVLDLFASPTLVSLSFDLERDPPLANKGEVSFRGIEAVPGILSVLDGHGAKATFFATGRVAERYPELLRDVLLAGHELGVHGGYYHETPLAGLPEEEQKRIILETALHIKNATGVMPRGYRAPGHRLDEATIGALEALNFTYDSSVVPSIGGLYLYGHPLGSPEGPYRPDREDPFKAGCSALVEIPLTPVLLNGNLDSIIAYQGRRAAEAELFMALFKAKLEGKPLVLYLHPGLMVDLPNEPEDYRARASLLAELDSSLSFLERFNARYVTLEELAYMSEAGQDL